MDTYRGFNTINQDKKFSLRDFDLVSRDLLNAFLIQQGAKPGKPDYGSKIWTFIFEPKTEDTVQAIYDEVERIAKLDPRVAISNMRLFTGEHSVIVEMDMLVLPNVASEVVALVFDEQLNTVYWRN